MLRIRSHPVKSPVDVCRCSMILTPGNCSAPMFVMENVTVNAKEQRRGVVIAAVDRGALSGGAGAAVRGVSAWQGRRLLAADRQRGVAALAHGNRGQVPTNAMNEEIPLSISPSSPILNRASRYLARALRPRALVVSCARRGKAMPDTTPTKDDLLAALAVESRYWDALVATVEHAGLMDRPGANNGPWTFRDMAAHLNGWRAWTITRMEAAQRGAGPPAHPWPAGLDEETEAGVDAINAWFSARDKDQPASEVLAESAAQFAALAVAVASMPSDDLLTPGRFAWLGDLPIAPAVLGSSFAHLHTDHEPDIRAWLRRETGGEPALPSAPPTFGYGE